MNTDWTCPLCRASNLVPAPVCRVCRTPWPGIRARFAVPDDDSDSPYGMFESLPAPMILLALATVLFFWWEPVTAPFSVPSGYSGWTASVRAGRRDELRVARSALVELADELKECLESGAPLAPDYNERLIGVRQRWQLYGERDRTEKLGPAEVKLHSAVSELSNLRFLLQAGTSPSELLDRLGLIYTVLGEVGEELKNG